MRYTQAQVREAVGLGVEAFRHWRAVLQLPAAKGGKGANFTFGDILALALIRSFNEQLGIPVGMLGSASSDLFRIFSGGGIIGFERSLVIFDGNSFSIVSSSGKLDSGRSVAAVILLAPIVDLLRSKLIGTDLPDKQQPLRFPSKLVGSA